MNPADSDEGTVFRGEYDWEEVRPNAAIVEALAAVTDTDPLEMEPLYNSIDPDALETLVDAGREASVRISFTYESWRVIVESHGTVLVRGADA